MKASRLEVMDWKKVEATAENLCREHLIGVAVNEKIRALAKEEIRKLGGKTSEEEIAHEKEREVEKQAG